MILIDKASVYSPALEKKKSQPHLHTKENDAGKIKMGLGGKS